MTDEGQRWAGASIAKQIAHTTIRIASSEGSGTGFFLQFDSLEPNHFIPLLVTNKHVVEGVDKVVLKFTKANSANEPLYGQHYELTVRNLRDNWVMHPTTTWI